MSHVCTKLGLVAAATTALGLLSGPAQAATSRLSEASASLLAGNVWMRPDDGTAWTNYVYNQAAPVALNADRLFSVIDAQGETQTTNFSHAASAASAFGELHVSASVTVGNPQQRGDRPLYAEYDGSGYAILPGGVPDGYGASAYASVLDTVFVMRPDVTRLQFQLGWDGTLSGRTEAERSIFMPAASVQLDQRDWNRNGAWSNVRYASEQPGFDVGKGQWEMSTTSLDATFWSNSFEVSNGKALVQFELWARAEVSELSGFGMQGGSFESRADFSHTVRVLGVRGFNAQGVELAMPSLVGESGLVYGVTTPVPEPSSWALLACGGVFLLGLSRRRHWQPDQG
jgi:hypothetical protein